MISSLDEHKYQDEKVEAAKPYPMAGRRVCPKCGQSEAAHHCKKKNELLQAFEKKNLKPRKLTNQGKDSQFSVHKGQSPQS